MLEILRKSDTGPSLAPGFGRERSAIHTTDEQPGIRRKGAPKRFYYLVPTAAGSRRATIAARIRALAIPPAWTDVWISPEADGHIQATGRDARGRKQYRYHPRWSACRDEAKYSSLVAFAEALPKLRERIEADLRRRGLPRDRVHRLGHLAARQHHDPRRQRHLCARQQELRPDHAARAPCRDRGLDAALRLQGQVGQGMEARSSIDRRIARIVEARRTCPASSCSNISTKTASGARCSSQDVNDYICARRRAPISRSKHFRTWGGTIGGARPVCRRAAARDQRADAHGAERR